MKKDIGHSPDMADAFMIAFAKDTHEVVSIAPVNSYQRPGWI